MKATCCICNTEGVVVSGKDIYEHRPDLWSKKIWRCPNHPDCYVGSHEKSGEALGVMADKNLRELKMKAHSIFDPWWKSRRVNRYRCYSRLANEMGIDINDCHFGHFKEEQLKKAIELIQDWED